MRWFRRKKVESEAAPEFPAGPSGIWVRYADGTRFDNVPCMYLRTDDEGIAQFELIPPREPWKDKPIAMGAALWPGKTGLVFPLISTDPDKGVSFGMEEPS